MHVGLSQIQKNIEEFHHHEEEPERTGTGDYRQFAAWHEQTAHQGNNGQTPPRGDALYAAAFAASQ
jgi:hypothetical protein